MKNQTRLDLNAAIQNRQQELGAQTNLVPEVRRELETLHRASVGQLPQTGFESR